MHELRQVNDAGTAGGFGASREHLVGVGAVLIAAILWGTTGTAATFAPDVSAVAIGAAAMGVGGILQALLALPGMMRSRAELAARWRLLVVGAIAVAIYPLVFYASMRMAGVTIGTVVTIGSAPFFSALLERAFDGLRPGRRWAFGAVVGLTGMALLCVAGKEAGPHAPHVGLGVGLGLAGGLTYALYSWAARRVMRGGIGSTAAMGAIFGCGGLLLMPVLLATGAPYLQSWTNAGVGIYMAVVPMFIGYVCFGYGLARISAREATTITLFEPVVAAVLAVLIVREHLTLYGWTGVALVIACLIWITGKNDASCKS